MRIDCKEYIDLIEEKLGDKKDYFRNSYDFLLNSIDRGKQIAAHLEKYVSLKDKKCLDMGCLDGGVSIGVAQQGANVTGVEINKDCLHRAKILNNFYKANCVFELRDCLNTHFEDDYFDIVICTDVIEHVASHDSLMREISRILRKQGYLYITIPNKISPKVIFTDPHFRIFGISLLPQKIGKFYAINIRKKLNPLYGYYHLGYYCTYFKMIQLFKKHHFLVQGEGGPFEKKMAYKLFREEFTFICKKN